MRWAFVLLTLLIATSASASERSPAYLDFDVAGGIHPGLSKEWGKIIPAVDLKLGGGFWVAQRAGGFAQVGLLNIIGVGSPAGATISDNLRDEFRLAPIRTGAKVNLWPRPDWVQFNLIAGASIVTGFHELSVGDTLARHSVSSFGFGGGIEWMAIRHKQFGFSARAVYYAQPTTLPTDQGFVIVGPTNLDVVELSVGYIFFLGRPH